MEYWWNIVTLFHAWHQKSYIKVVTSESPSLKRKKILFDMKSNGFIHSGCERRSICVYNSESYYNLLKGRQNRKNIQAHRFKTPASMSHKIIHALMRLLTRLLPSQNQNAFFLHPYFSHGLVSSDFDLCLWNSLQCRKCSFKWKSHWSCSSCSFFPK